MSDGTRITALRDDPDLQRFEPRLDEAFDRFGTGILTEFRRSRMMIIGAQAVTATILLSVFHVLGR